MKNLLIATILAVTSTSAMASSFHPCTPSVKAQDTRIVCKAGGNTFSIVIKSLMPPNIAMCQGSQHFTVKTANIVELDALERVISKSTVYNGDFSYTLSASGDATFSSSKADLNLSECVTPLHGAVSFGN